MKRIFFSAGEASGDIHGANLIRAIRRIAPDTLCEGLGGTRMAAAGMDLHCDLAGRAIMGFSEVLRSLAYIRAVFNNAVAHLERHPPDALVVIDYPGFNIRLAKKAHALGIPVIYYISPQIWAWKKKRIHTIVESSTRVLAILPFEPDLYANAGGRCIYVGHPLLDHIDAFEPRTTYTGECVVGILPGSREQEIARLLPVMLDTAKAIQREVPEATFVCTCVDELRARQIRTITGNFPMEIGIGTTYDLLQSARFCMVASGTATLETALFGVPMVVLYRVSPLSYLIARTLVDIEHIALVNILSGKRVVPEFIQHDAQPERILPVALDLIRDTGLRSDTIAELAQLRATMGPPGASERAARAVLEAMGET